MTDEIVVGPLPCGLQRKAERALDRLAEVDPPPGRFAIEFVGRGRATLTATTWVLITDAHLQAQAFGMSMQQHGHDPFEAYQVCLRLVFDALDHRRFPEKAALVLATAATLWRLTDVGEIEHLAALGTPIVLVLRRRETTEMILTSCRSRGTRPAAGLH